ncbi:MAG: hypothetical protein P8Y93_07390 [Acidobacteriota bacterium]
MIRRCSGRQQVVFDTLIALIFATAPGAASAGETPPFSPLATETKLLPTVTEQLGWDVMGFPIEIDGTTLVTLSASDFEAQNSCAAFVFQLDAGSWTHRATLRREADGAWRGFSYVSVSGSTVGVGAWQDFNTAGVTAGLVYLFQDTSAVGNWSSFSTVTIEAADGQEGDEFGYRVALWHHTLVVAGAGALYVFTDTSGAGDWSSYSEVKITPSDGSEIEVLDVAGPEGGEFGATIVARHYSGDTVFVFRDTSAAHDWSSHLEVALAIPPPPGSDFFSGSSVAINGRTVVTGETHRDHTAQSQGSVFVFQDTSISGDWSSYSVAEVFSPNLPEFSYLGEVVDVEEGTILAGAPQNYPYDGLTGTGTALVFEDTSSAGDWSSYSETELVPPAVAINDRFGSSVALEGMVAAAGAYYGDVAALRDGFVDLFDGEASWGFAQRLTQEGIGDQERQYFGWRVGTDGSTVVVSAPLDDLDMAASGSLFVYQRQDGSWVERRKVQAAETLYYDHFGQGTDLEPGKVFAAGWGSYLSDPDEDDIPAHLTVLTDTSANGDWQSLTEVTLPFDDIISGGPVAAEARNVAVGNTRYGVPSEPIGEVRLFHDASPDGDWSSVTERTIHAWNSYPGLGFGSALALRQRVMLVGSPDADQPNAECGVASLFFDTSAAADWSSFTESVITLEGGMPYDHFGSAVALEDGWAAIGEPGDDNVLLDGGAVHILVDTSGDGSWSTYDMLKLVPPDPDLITEHAGLGSALAAWGRILVVGAPSTDAPDEAGSVWVFADTSPDADWCSTAWARLVPSDSAPGDNFGASVAVAASTVGVGAPLHTAGDLTTGAAYIFESWPASLRIYL